jgi:phage repressor protein C with HTH and peptisase S24 domain
MKKNSEISERITETIELLNINRNIFSKKLGYDRAQTIYDIAEGKSAPSFDFFQRFMNSEYSEIISIKWILTGKGSPMMSNDKNLYAENNKLNIIEEHTIERFNLKTDNLKGDQQIPLYDMEAVAGLVPLFNDTIKQIPIDYIRIPNLPKCDGAIHITGDSMYPLLKSGDIVLYKQVHDVHNCIFWGEMYLISIDIEGEEYVTVKYIQKSDILDHVRLVSYNQHHSDKDVPISSIRALAFVKASVRVNSMK